MKRTYGRLNGIWTQVNTDANGYNDSVYVTTIAQVIKLSPGESPFYANYGIPAQECVMKQIYPSYYVSKIQNQFSGFFSNLVVAEVQGTRDPTYNITALTNQGASIIMTVAV